MVQEVIIQDRRIDVDLYIDVIRADIIIGATTVIVQSAPSISLPVTGNWMDVSGNIIAAGGAYYEVDTSGGVATIFLPANVDAYDDYKIFVRDKRASFATNNCRIVPAVGSGDRIAGLAIEEMLEIDYSPNGGFFMFMYDPALKVWSW